VKGTTLLAINTPFGEKPPSRREEDTL